MLGGSEPSHVYFVVETRTTCQELDFTFRAIIDIRDLVTAVSHVSVTLILVYILF
jgi:hypothetical protein